MAKKTPPQVEPEKPQAQVQTFTRLRAIRHGHNDVELVEDTYEAVPALVKRVYRGATSGAQYHAKVWNTEKVGPDRYGDCGL